MLSCNFLNLQHDIEMINESEADWFHLDIMDGVFVPNITFGQPIIKYIKKAAKKPLDVHLMIVQPERYFQDFKESGADILSFHYEASTHLHRSIYAVKNLGMKVGVTLNPHTDVKLLEDVISDVDMVLIMSVNPGFGGQRFIENSYRKIKTLNEMILRHNSTALIEVDGGVTLENAADLVACGVDVLVAGNTIFSHPNPPEAIRRLKMMGV